MRDGRARSPYGYIFWFRRDIVVDVFFFSVHFFPEVGVWQWLLLGLLMAPCYFGFFGPSSCSMILGSSLSAVLSFSGSMVFGQFLPPLAVVVVIVIVVYSSHHFLFFLFPPFFLFHLPPSFPSTSSPLPLFTLPLPPPLALPLPLPLPPVRL